MKKSDSPANQPLNPEGSGKSGPRLTWTRHPIELQEVLTRGLATGVLAGLMALAVPRIDARLRGLTLTKRLLNHDAAMTPDEIVEAAEFIAANRDLFAAASAPPEEGLASADWAGVMQLADAAVPICATPTKDEAPKGLPGGEV